MHACVQSMRQRSDLNQKEMELLEMREQYARLVVRRGTCRPNMTYAHTIIMSLRRTSTVLGCIWRCMQSGRLKLFLPLSVPQSIVLAPAQARSNEARANWEEALAAKDRAIVQLEEALSAERQAAEQARVAAAAAASQAQAKVGSVTATESALAEARSEADRLRRQARDNGNIAALQWACSSDKAPVHATPYM